MLGTNRACWSLAGPQPPGELQTAALFTELRNSELFIFSETEAGVGAGAGIGGEEGQAASLPSAVA